MAGDTYIKIGDIKSDSRDAAHQEWIEVRSFQNGASQGGGGSSSGAGAHSRGRVDVSNFFFKKDICPASPLLFLKCCTGENIPEATLEVCRSMGEKTTFHKLTFKDLVISKYEIIQNDDGEAGGLPTELIGLKFDQLHVEHTPTDPRSGGKTGAAVQAAWHVGENQMI